MDRPQRNLTDRWLALATGTATLALLLATLDAPLITWDEGFTIRREELMRDWFRLLVSPTPAISREQLFSANVLYQFWPYARQEPDGHPPVYAAIGNLGWLLSHKWLDPLGAHRFGPALLFSIATAVMYRFMAGRLGRLAGFTAAGSWLLMPRVFAHAHLASYDIPLACLWFLTVVAFWKANERWQVSRSAGMVWSAIFAFLLALAAATKFTGWLIPLPLLAWSVCVGIAELRRDGLGSLRKLVSVGVSLIPLALLTPNIFGLMREVTQIESSLEQRPGENSQQRAAWAASELRARESTGMEGWCILLPIAAWCGLWAWRCWRAVPEIRRPIGMIPEIWVAAVWLSPALTMMLIPNWWANPRSSIAIFLWSNLSRQKTTWIPTQFFGTLYEFSLPWYNTLAWVFLTVPPPTLLLIVFGTIATIFSRKRTEVDREGAGERRKVENAVSLASQSEIENQKSTISLASLLLINAATLLVIRALPGAPGHDGERQLLGSFPFIACLAGLGAEWLRVKLASIAPTNVANWVARALVGVSLAWSAAAVWHYRAAPLSYYTELVGGVRGATRLGLEPTYYWDALDQVAIEWLNQNTRPGESVLFCNDFRGLQYLRQWGKLRVSQFPHERGVPKWYVLQNRPGLFAETPWNRWLAEHGELAAFTHELDRVPLIWIFPIEAHEESIRQTKRANEGR